MVGRLNKSEEIWKKGRGWATTHIRARKLELPRGGKSDGRERNASVHHVNPPSRTTSEGEGEVFEGVMVGRGSGAKAFF